MEVEAKTTKKEVKTAQKKVEGSDRRAAIIDCNGGAAGYYNSAAPHAVNAYRSKHKMENFLTEFKAYLNDHEAGADCYEAEDGAHEAYVNCFTFYQDEEFPTHIAVAFEARNDDALASNYAEVAPAYTMHFGLHLASFMQEKGYVFVPRRDYTEVEPGSVSRTADICNPRGVGMLFREAK